MQLEFWIWRCDRIQEYYLKKYQSKTESLKQVYHWKVQWFPTDVGKLSLWQVHPLNMT